MFVCYNLSIMMQKSEKRRIKWSVRAVVPLMMGVMVIVSLIVGAIGIIGKRMRLNADVMAERMEVVDWTIAGRKKGNSEIVYVPEYYYKVDGEEYTCRGAYEHSRDDVSRELVRIYYIQDNPAECLTEKQLNMDKNLWWVIIVGAIVVMFGVGGIALGIHTLRYPEDRWFWL